MSGQRPSTPLPLSSPCLGHGFGAPGWQLREEADANASGVLRVQRLHSKGAGREGGSVGLEPAQGAV